MLPKTVKILRNKPHVGAGTSWMVHSQCGAVSLNGLHVMPSPKRFVSELGRVIRPGGRLFMITLVSGGNRRGDAVILGGRLSGILPGPPPQRKTLLRSLRHAGFTDIEDLGGEALVGVAATRG